MKIRLRKKRGDTLLEVTIALSILSLLITIGATGGLRALRTANLARERTIASQIAKSQVDMLRSYRNSFDWDEFISNARMGTVVIDWAGTGCGLPVPGGGTGCATSPNVTLSDLETTVNTGPNDAGLNKMFFMEKGPSGWQQSTKAVSLQRGLYYVTIIPNKANVADEGAPVGEYGKDLIRFDVRVLWQSNIGGGPPQDSSFVVYMGRTESFITGP